MKGLLVRVGADSGDGGGYWNPPADSTTCEFAYVPIPESSSIRPGFAKPYSFVGQVVKRFGLELPDAWSKFNMHLDPDFDYLTYGDIGKPGHRGAQIKEKLSGEDLLVFYASFKDVNPNPELIYAIIGLYVIDSVISAATVPKCHWNKNAHTRRALAATALDIVVRAKPKLSGRLKSYIAIGEYRRRAYRVKSDLLEAWGDLTVNDGYLQRSARLPAFRDAGKFYNWFLSKETCLIQRNN